jgi:hypothetical protein
MADTRLLFLFSESDASCVENRERLLPSARPLISRNHSGGRVALAGTWLDSYSVGGRDSVDIQRQRVVNQRAKPLQALTPGQSRLSSSRKNKSGSLPAWRTSRMA